MHSRGQIAMRKLIITLIVLLIPLAAQAETNYCHDPESNAECEELINKHPNDMGIQALHALRIGLCQKVDKEVLTIPEATKIFEDMRKALIERRAMQERAEQMMKEKEL
jgi:hypothetical protein